MIRRLSQLEVVKNPSLNCYSNGESLVANKNVFSQWERMNLERERTNENFSSRYGNAGE